MFKRFIKKIYRCAKPIVVNGTDNKVSVGCKYSGFRLTILGNHNKVSVDKNCILNDTIINILGDDAIIEIDKNARLLGPCKITIVNGGKLYIGQNAGVRGVEFELGDGADISVGEYCMFSYNINLRNFDSHKIYQQGSDIVTNPAQNITIGKHVWICKNVSFLKGSSVDDNSVVGYGSLVTKKFPSNCVIAGVPAQIVKREINWGY
ncbi:acyltransferase [Prevotella sp. kh1p2]|uniref:acyltransferase n=1 Tax=Prevotella sp. kh1p2 TaxID=1761883 RepID=UPI0008C4BC26|nr:hypothetical protein [Prevotella sp. kh1p2]SET10820.1 transferase hexapeptide (six repeat-containing protein) [Prevotella sp. kh1p2]SNU11840.1 transferase hexapeptide (six repeat-containing protein) [Prevotellaceae bacterium KH2P17]